MPLPDDAESFSGLVTSIYRAAECPAAWRDVVEQLRARLDGTGATIMYFDTRRPSSILAKTVGYSPDDIRRYEQYYSHVDPWGVALGRRRWTTGRAIDGRALAPDHVVRRSEYFADFGRYVGSGRSACLPLERSSDRLCLAVIARSHTQPEFDRPQITLLDRLGPHLQQAFRIHRRLSQAEHLNASAGSILERLPVGVLLLSRAGQVLKANAAAERILAAGDGMRIECGHVLGSRSHSTHLLQQAIGRATGAGQLVVPSASSLSIDRPSGRSPHRVVVAPAAGAVTTATDAMAEVVVFISDSETTCSVHPESLVEMFGLTRAEAAVTSLLVGGATSEAIARELGIKVSTARWHIKQVLQKLQVGSQAQLVSLVLNSPAGLR